jgi:hypothetical protein
MNSFLQIRDWLKKYNSPSIKDLEKREKYQKEYWQSERGKEVLKKYYKRNSEKILEKQKEYEQSPLGKKTIKKYAQSEKGKIKFKKYKQSEKGKEIERKYRQSQTGKKVTRKSELKIKYNLTLEQYEKMMQSQNGFCLLCGGQGGKKALCVDHCHVTGKIRGLLCDLCNRGLGYFKDNPKTLQNAIKYLTNQNHD